MIIVYRKKNPRNVRLCEHNNYIIFVIIHDTSNCNLLYVHVMTFFSIKAIIFSYAYVDAWLWHVIFTYNSVNHPNYLFVSKIKRVICRIEWYINPVHNIWCLGVLSRLDYNNLYSSFNKICSILHHCLFTQIVIICYYFTCVFNWCKNSK